jgi:hypothetical protein
MPESAYPIAFLFGPAPIGTWVASVSGVAGSAHLVGGVRNRSLNPHQGQQGQKPEKPVISAPG